MRLFNCPNCKQVLYFENTQCARCGHTTGYVPSLDEMTTVEPDGAQWIALVDRRRRYRFCQNWEHLACNWLVAAEEEQPLCSACRHNRTIPAIGNPASHAAWIRVESAKRRLIYTLHKLQLPVPSIADGHPEPLIFDFLEDQPGQKVLTGHTNGVITLSMQEADDAAREQLRTSMNEPYRTLLGHFRHEIGHYYWDLLVRDGNRVDEFREVFGDERQDYEEARKCYYTNGPLSGWQEDFVSAYATMHPWEDFAETWAHYMHMVDTLEMATSFGIRLAPRVDDAEPLSGEINIDPYRSDSATELVAAWLPTTFAVNSLNRAMGQPDLYPFIISPNVIAKIEAIRRLVQPVASLGTSRPAENGGIIRRSLHIWRQRRQR
jgi:hypothetical protein